MGIRSPAVANEISQKRVFELAEPVKRPFFPKHGAMKNPWISLLLFGIGCVALAAVNSAGGLEENDSEVNYEEVSDAAGLGRF